MKYLISPRQVMIRNEIVMISAWEGMIRNEIVMILA
jgi:hypothetical protein